MAKKPEAKQDSAAKRRLEAIAAALGAALTLATLGVIVWDGLRAGDVPPFVAVEALGVHARDGGFVLEILARNRGAQAATAVEVAGTLKRGEEIVAESAIVFDQVAGRSERRGGLFFAEDPRAFEVELRALGYAEP